MEALQAITRVEKGTSNVRRMRREGRLPGNIYKEGTSALGIELETREVESFLRNHSGESLLVDMSIDGDSPRPVLIKEIQQHPVTSRLLHLDVYEITANRPIVVDVMIAFDGTPVGVTQAGGTLEYLLRSITVKCLPKDLVETIEVDVSALEVGEQLRVDDLVIDRVKYKVITPADIAVCNISKPRISGKGEAEEDAGGEEGAEGEETAGADA